MKAFATLSTLARKGAIKKLRARMRKIRTAGFQVAATLNRKARRLHLQKPRVCQKNNPQFKNRDRAAA